MRVFLEYDWPGNVRELENAARRIVVLGTALTVHQEIAARLGGGPRPAVTPSAVTATVNPEQMISLKDIARRAARDAERVAINEVLDRVHWNRAKAARLLQIEDRKSTRLNSSHVSISYAVFCLKKKKTKDHTQLEEQYAQQPLE